MAVLDEVFHAGRVAAEQGPAPLSRTPAIKAHRVFDPGSCRVTQTQDGNVWKVYHKKKYGARDGTGSSASIRPGSILREISGEMLHGLSLAQIIHAIFDGMLAKAPSLILARQSGSLRGTCLVQTSCLSQGQLKPFGCLYLHAHCTNGL